MRVTYAVLVHVCRSHSRVPPAALARLAERIQRGVVPRPPTQPFDGNATPSSQSHRHAAAAAAAVGNHRAGLTPRERPEHQQETRRGERRREAHEVTPYERDAQRQMRPTTETEPPPQSEQLPLKLEVNVPLKRLAQVKVPVSV